jgi:predicted MFS family arabinose efflux permease
MSPRLPLPVVAVCGLVFCAELGQAMLVPLLPELGRAFRLSPAETGALLSAATLATLATAVPAGLAAERFGALRISLAAGVTMAAAAMLQAVAAGLPAFVAGRLLFGVGFAAIWTAGMALLSPQSAPRTGVGAAMAAGGLAHLVGPPLSGVLSDAAGRALPFWLLAAFTGAVVLVGASGRIAEPGPAPASGLRAAARAALRDPTLRGATTIIGLAGVLTGLVPLAVPLLLDRAGFSAAGIGTVFAAGSVVWVAASLLALRAGARAATLGAAAAGLALLAAASLLPVVAPSVACLVAFVVLRAAIQAPLATASYGLGARGARAAGVAVGTAMGLLNLVWATCATVAPLVAGAVLAGAGARWVFALLALVCAAAALSLRPPALRRDAREGRLARLDDVEALGEAGDLEHHPDVRVGVDDDREPPLVTQLGGDPQQRGDCDRVEEEERKQVDHDAPRAAGQRGTEQLADLRDGRDVELAGDGDDEAVRRERLRVHAEVDGLGDGAAGGMRRRGHGYVRCRHIRGAP